MKLLFVLISVFFCLQPAPTSSCTCSDEQSMEKAISTSDLIFTGDVVGKKIISGNTRDENGKLQSLRYTRYALKVEQVYKGNNVFGKHFIYALNDSASCGLILKTSNKYAIFATKGSYVSSSPVLSDLEKKGYWVNSCSKTVVFDNKIQTEIEKELNREKE